MFNDLSLSINESPINYPIFDSALPFADYISKSRVIVEERRTDLNQSGAITEAIINANTPFELYPNDPIRCGKRLKYGALLIHGLLDCSFSLRDVGMQLQANGILSRAILLPGHGTTPSDLLHTSYHEWIQAVRYGVETLRREVEHVFLIGYSTGATLSIYQALQDAKIAGIIMLSPAIKIKIPVDIAVAWHRFTRWLGKDHKQWLCLEPEIDYAKYRSITFNAVAQVAELTDVIRKLRHQHQLTTPVYMVLSREDETISSHRAIDFFSSMHNQDSRLLLYTSINHRYPDPRILTRLVNDTELNTKHFSHISLPYTANNPHYGAHGDYMFASRIEPNHTIYGAYNRIEERFFNILKSLHITQYNRRGLTFNPDFDYMAKEISQFITRM